MCNSTKLYCKIVFQYKTNIYIIYINIKKIYINLYIIYKYFLYSNLILYKGGYIFYIEKAIYIEYTGSIYRCHIPPKLYKLYNYINI